MEKLDQVAAAGQLKIKELREDGNIPNAELENMGFTSGEHIFNSTTAHEKDEIFEIVSMRDELNIKLVATEATNTPTKGGKAKDKKKTMVVNRLELMKDWEVHATIDEEIYEPFLSRTQLRTLSSRKIFGKA